MCDPLFGQVFRLDCSSNAPLIRVRAHIASYVEANPGLDPIHLISNGSPGQVAVDASTLSEATVGRYSGRLNQIDASLNLGGNLLIYCSVVAQEAIGQRLITSLYRVTRLDAAPVFSRS